MFNVIKSYPQRVFSSILLSSKAMYVLKFYLKTNNKYTVTEAYQLFVSHYTPCCSGWFPALQASFVTPQTPSCPLGRVPVWCARHTLNKPPSTPAGTYLQTHADDPCWLNDASLTQDGKFMGSGAKYLVSFSWSNLFNKHANLYLCKVSYFKYWLCRW